MGGYPRYCVQCGSGLASNTRFCGNCGHAAADTEADVSGQHAMAARELDWPGPAAETRPGGLPPVPRSPVGWEAPEPPTLTTPLSSAAPPRFAAPPTGPAYPPPPAQYALPAGPPPAPSSPPPPGATANLSTSWVNEVGLKPRWDQGPSALRLITESRTTGDQPRQRRSLVIGLFLLIAAVLVVPALLIVHAFHGLGGTSAAAAQPTSRTSAPSAVAAPNERAAATALASLLGQSVTDRDTIVNAVGAVNQCTSGLSQAPQAFTDGATGRQKLLQQLAHLPGRSTLPAGMLRELTGAWQASATVDTDLGKWAQDEVAHGCHQNDHNDANFAASNTPDVQASNDKAAFVARWSPIAAKYGLTRYSTSQL